MTSSSSPIVDDLDAWGASAADRLPAWGDRRAPMLTERRRFDFFESVPMLMQLDRRVRWSLAYECTEVRYESCEAIVHENSNDEVGHVWFVREGEIVISNTAPIPGSHVDEDGLTRDADGRRVAIDPITGGRAITTLRAGDVLGDSAVVDTNLQGCVARAGSFGVDLIKIDSQTFHKRIAEHVFVFQMIREEYAGNPPDVQRLGIFNDLPMADLKTVMDCAEQATFAPGDAIISQGALGDRFYLILSGKAVVVKDDETVATLERGDYFGELALLQRTTRNATVRATEPTHCWSIGREAFEAILRARLMRRAVATGSPAQAAAASTFTAPQARKTGAGGSSLADLLRRSS